MVRAGAKRPVPGPAGPGRRPARLIGGLAAFGLVAALAGCTGGSDGASGPATTTSGSGAVTTTAPSSSGPTTSAPATQAPTTQPPATTSPATTSPTTQPPATTSPTTPPPTTPPPTTSKPVTRDGPCPYLEAEFVKETIGQHLGRTTYTTADPPVCTFYRTDGDWGATVTPTNVATANEAARQAVTIPGANSQPVDLPSGGAVNIIKDGAILATSRGTLLLVVKINQKSPLEATEIARQVLSAL